MDRPDAGKDGRARSLISPAQGTGRDQRSCLQVVFRTRTQHSQFAPERICAACASFGLAYGAAGVRAELLLL
jgi:hypothetical protein